jgi:hypothetical protein
MTIRQEMHTAAKKAKNLLGDSSKLVVQFVQSRLNEDGGFSGRDGKSDLYYTVFGIEILRALGEEIPINALKEFLLHYKNGEELDLVHLACLVRCWANLSQETFPLNQRLQFQGQFEKFRSAEGGYAHDSDASYGSAYGCFLVLGAYQDMQLELPDKNKMIGCIKSLSVKDGGFSNDSSAVKGSAPATAAAVSVLRQLGHPVDKSVSDWLLKQCYQQGGFVAGPSIPLPDLLSTATALHALAAVQTDFGNIREECLDFLDSLWSGKGGFCGNWADRVRDCEYTYYGLLALGHLAGAE